MTNTEAVGAPAATDALEMRDTRTGKTYTAPIADGAIRASDLRQIKTDSEDFGLMSYDPAFMNTASCRSAITFIDGDKGILRYRGYPIEQLAERASFLEVAWLLRNGELPNQEQYDRWVHDITFHTYVHENIKRVLEGFRYDAHPMSMLCSSIAALSSFYPEAKSIFDPDQRYISISGSWRRSRRWRRSSIGTTRDYRSSIRTTTSRTPRTSFDDRSHERVEVRGEPGVHASDRGPLHPARRSRAELLDERRAPWARRTSIRFQR
jgi:hypothetical protein